MIYIMRHGDGRNLRKIIVYSTAAINGNLRVSYFTSRDCMVIKLVHIHVQILNKEKRDKIELLFPKST